ncbi:DNA-dependent protein kinase catalytic subunit-like [Melanaphis sacchari]|uniref:DNA-dependent protein kinase catalytic subunit-like n=1 Tax=Melanaphis sacchari TaxID=742174 RepID=UPI000DC1374D|nr:DNA-dependent protein kinase catalytic subunit-like [Melanaphis sacchari]
MSTIKLCLCALHTDIAQNGSNLDVLAAQQRIFQINQYFKSDITSIESELALKILFADDKGIIRFAKSIISLDSTNTKMVTADILFLFQQLIELFPIYVVNYIRPIMNLCNLSIITSKKNADLSIRTYQIYEKLLEIKHFSDQIEINKIVEHLDNQVSLGDKIPPTARQHIYNLFGVIAQHHPMYLKNYEDKLMNLFCYELQNQIDIRETNLKKFLPPVAIGCLNGLTGFLNNFADHIKTHDYCLRLYEILKKLIGIVEENKRHVINRTGLNLFQKHIQLFLKLLFKNLTEIMWFQKKLWDWSLLPNIEDKKIGLFSFEILYKGASIEFSKHNINTGSSIQQEIIKNMIKFLKLKLCDLKLNYQEHAAVVRSIGWLAEPCNNLLGEEHLIEIFTILSLKAEEKYLNCQIGKSTYDPNAANYLNSLSLIIRNIKSLNTDQFLFIQKLSIYCFNDFIFAQSKSEWQDNISNAIIISIYCIALSHEKILDQYLKQLFYVGLIKSCSHRAAIDAEIVEECTGHVLIKSTNYVSLWISLLKAHQCHLFDLYLNIPIIVKSILEKSLMCSFMSSVLKIIRKLDLFTNKSSDELEVEYIARKPSDITALVNLVEIYSDVLHNLELDIESAFSWLPYTLNVIINHSIEYPTISSLYRILTVIFQELDWCKFLEETNNNTIKENIIEYVNCVMVYINTFKGDLQYCCLKMLMNLPSVIIKEIFNTQIVEVVKSTLIVGSTFLPLAKTAVSALKTWQQDLSKNEMDQLLKCIMPYLDLLLRTKGYDNEVELNNLILDKMQIQDNKKRTLLKQNKLIMKPETELEIVQIQILEYIAQLDMSTCLKLLGDPDKIINYPRNIINYQLSFNDCKINISFDHLLPRILELCQYCSNRQIRFTACEIFHAYIILYLGNNLILERSKPTEMEIVTIKIIPIVIKLACDMDNLIQQLFEPLAIGIVHYFASGIQYNSIYTPIIIDILMDSISENSNEAVRDFSAKCIMEFLRWSLKESNLSQKLSISLRIVIKKIKSFCLHSDPNKQLGAAIAFNSCYSILREDENIIDELWIQLLYYFIVKLDSTKSTNSEQHVLKSIDHLQRVFLEKSNLFNEVCISRIIPKPFLGTQLFNVVEWLLRYIGSPMTSCRSKCLNMANSLSKNVKDHYSLKSIINSFIMSHGEKELIKCIERDLNSFNVLTNINILIHWLNQLIATLDCYTSLFKRSMMDIIVLKNPCSCLFQSIHQFLFHIEEFSLMEWLIYLNIPFKESDKNIIIQSRYFNTLKNHVIVGIFQFINAFENNLISGLLDDENHEKVYNLAIKYLFDCEMVYSDEKLNQHKLVILQYIKIPYISNKFNNKLKQHLSKNWSKIELNFNTLTEFTFKRNFIAVNQLILECNIFSTLDLEKIVNRKYILENVFKYVYNDGVIVILESTRLSYFENLIEFLINLDCGYYLKNPDIFVIKLLTEYPLNDQILYVILEILRSSNNKNKNGQGKLLIEKIVNNRQFCEEFKKQFTWNELFEFVELSSNIVDHFRNENMQFFQRWICEHLTNNNLNIYHKCRLLGFLPKLVSNQNYKENLDCTIRLSDETQLLCCNFVYKKFQNEFISEKEMFKFFTNIELKKIPYTYNGSQSKDLITQFRTSAVKVRYSNVDYTKGSNEIKQLFRQLHCYSYNTLITIISNTEDDVNKYTIFLFNERPTKQFIWRNLVDCSKCYEFPIDFEMSQSFNQMLSVELEMDSFNNHECMAHLCAVIKYLTSENLIGTTKKPNMDMPNWMNNLKLVFCDNSTDTINSKILLIKLIINCETNFEPYAKHWFSPLMQFVLDKHLGNNLNYFITDVVSMLVSWHNTAVPSTEDEKLLAKKLFSFLLSVSHSEVKNIFKHNMEFINGTDNQLICLKIVLQLIPTIHAENLIILIKIIAEISQQKNNDHRKLIYEIMYVTYEIYLGNNTNTSKQITEQCKMVLLNGLMDNDDELRHKVFRFWADDKRLPLKCVDRLLILLDQLYSPDIESHFLGNFVSILLESCCTALDYNQNIFQYPLHACKFEDYNLTTTWRAKHTSTFPKFADTIVSQLNRSNTLGNSESNIKEKFQIKNTMTLQFQPTIIQTQLTDSISILKSYSQMPSDEINISTLGKERAQKRESSVNTYRKYRIGDFPDIEISNASVIKPLIELSKRDNNIARIISSSIMYGLKNNPKVNEQYFESLNKSLITMLNHSHGNHSLTGFILDTACCYPTQINLDPNKVTEVATSCGLMSLGALVIETSINYLQSTQVDLHIEKKSKITYKCLDDNWIKLAEIYKNMGELDVVEGIFQEKVNNLSCDSLKEALKAEQSQDWRMAQIKFKSCSENLSDWKEIKKMLKSQTGESYERIWDNNWYKNHLLHRILQSELNEILNGTYNDKFIETFSNWLNDKHKEEYILTCVPAQACMIFLCCDDLNKAQLWCKLGMRNFLKEWENISPQYYKLRASKLLNLQTLSEIYIISSKNSVLKFVY